MLKISNVVHTLQLASHIQKLTETITVLNPLLLLDVSGPQKRIKNSIQATWNLKSICV